LLLASGSAVVDETSAVVVRIVPGVTVPATLTTSVKVALDRFRSEIVATTVPVPPAGGVVVAKPLGAANETNVVPAGSGIDSDTLLADSGPALVRFTV
jgi:hypothetical protein